LFLNVTFYYAFESNITFKFNHNQKIEVVKTMDNESNKIMEIAVEEAIKGVKKGHGGPFGAVIVKDGKIIARGHNMVLKTKDPTAHAEIVAIRKASKKLKRFDLSDCELYTSCMPCPMCLSAIYWARIKKVYFGCDSKDAENIGFDDKRIYDFIKNDPVNTNGEIKFIQLERDQCLKAFELWQNKKDKTMY